MSLRTFIRAFGLASGVALFLAGTALAARPGSGASHPALPGTGVQAGAESGMLPATASRVEMQLGHESNIVAPNSGAYSYSVLGVTDTGYRLRMGYIVLAGESGLARWFIQVFDNNDSEVYWKLSRAGETNPPPGCSACSGDNTTDGYPFAFGYTNANTWTFWFDWITKAQYKSAKAGNRLIKVYYLAETASAPELMGPRLALKTFRVWPDAASGWTEPDATAFYSMNASCTYGLEVKNALYLDAYHSIRAGSGVSGCPTGQLW